MKYPLYPFLPVLILVACCQQSQDSLGPASSPDSEWHNRALLIAGLPIPDKYAKREDIRSVIERPHYREHVRQMQGFWESVRRQRVKPMTAWWRSQLSPRIDGLQSRVALYPLSGGDFLNFKLMYPDAKRYIMIAMEKPGKMPEASTMQDDQLQEGLYSVRKMLGNIALTGYFFSRWMNSFMNPEKYGYYGTLPTISVFIVRLGHRIKDVQFTCVNNEGKLVSEPSPVCHLPGYRILFEDARTREDKELIYLSTRIDNDLFAQQSPRGKFIRSQGRMQVMMKAAVYLFHKRQYRPAAQYLLENSEIIIQDDSGIPFNYFRSDRWNIALYGTYSDPLPGMGVFPQKDLIAAYGRGSRNLPFVFGYGPKTRARASGLMVAFSKE